MMQSSHVSLQRNQRSTDHSPCAVPKVPDADSTLELKVPETPDTLVVELKALAATDPEKTPESPFN